MDDFIRKILNEQKIINEGKTPMTLSFIKDEIFHQAEIMNKPECKKEEYNHRQKIIKYLKLIGKEQRLLEVKYDGAFKTSTAPPDYFRFEDGGEIDKQFPDSD